MLNCVVVDDEPLAARLIASYIEKTPGLTLAGEFNSAADALKTIMEQSIDLIFLDIKMPQLNGMEFARLLPERSRIIFTTAYDSFAVEGYKVNALDYLLKPVSYDEFLQAAVRAQRAIQGAADAAARPADTPSHIIVKSEYKLIQIPLADILYIEGLKDYIKIYLDGADKCIMTLMSMHAIEERLPADDFIRVHRSFIVNKARITVIERNRIVMGRTQIPVSESYRTAFNQFVASRAVNHC